MVSRPGEACAKQSISLKQESVPMLWLILIGLAILLFAAIPLIIGEIAAWLYKKLSRQ
jgi:hypothetical protein